ncbi:hypothetical protein HELRODRAFT_169264 [Helobdella robusta]|uniref:Ig-like domain-containing protein n=1 Tax=Helobdella robusta TaxID=6412 RepID=T1F1N6_HELRO|nr:hypothetical protein HELRODRAFT_169264 [Helobdella robusta]ESO08422.1 hypothetical protein HELRODRAFT_169264 [Helobdella robusta]
MTKRIWFEILRNARRTFRLSRDSSVACRIRFKITQLNYCNQETQIEVLRPIGKNNISLLQGLRTHSVAGGKKDGVLTLKQLQCFQCECTANVDSMSDEVYSVVRLNGNIKWFCDKCVKNVCDMKLLSKSIDDIKVTFNEKLDKLNDVNASIKTKLEETDLGLLNKSIDEISKSLDEKVNAISANHVAIKSQLDSIECTSGKKLNQEISGLKSEMMRSFASVVSTEVKQSAKIINEDLKNVRKTLNDVADAKEREANAMLFRLGEGLDDKDRVIKMIAKLTDDTVNGKNILKVFRLGKRGEGVVRPILTETELKGITMNSPSKTTPLSTLIINSVDDEAIISSLPPFSKSSSPSFQEHHQTMKLDHHYQHYKDEDIGAFESKNEADSMNGYYYDDDGVDDAGRSSNSFHNYSKNKFTNVTHSNRISTLTQRQVAQTFSPPRPQSLTVHSTSPPNHYDSHPSLVGVMESLESLEQEIQRLYVEKNGKEESGSHYIVEDVDSISLNKTGNNYFSAEHVHRNLNNKINSNYTQSKYNSLVGTPASHIGRNVTYVAGRASRLSCIASGFYPPVTLSVLVAQINISNNMMFHQRMWLGEGVKGFRPIHFESIRWMDTFKPTADNDGSEVACVATLSTSSASTSNNYTFLHLLVNYAPIVSCSALHAQLNQAEAVLTCSIRAQPGVVSILWHYPNNQQGNATRHQQHHQQQKYLGADENSMQNRVVSICLYSCLSIMF